MKRIRDVYNHATATEGGGAASSASDAIEALCALGFITKCLKAARSLTQLAFIESGLIATI